LTTGHMISAVFNGQKSKQLEVKFLLDEYYNSS
jgi:hypothetical protein